MRGVAYDPVFRAKVMAMREEGVSFAGAEYRIRDRAPGTLALVEPLRARRPGWPDTAQSATA
jgi:hypothetical protein